jgi:hypothetical protein
MNTSTENWTARAKGRATFERVRALALLPPVRRDQKTSAQW